MCWGVMARRSETGAWSAVVVAFEAFVRHYGG
jgi:hypothetical protein